ncbi:sugar nucleotide-binding protein, partial [Clostridium perfringens]
MKVLITGAQGQLGQDIAQIFIRAGHEVFGYGREELNITDLDQCLRVVSTHRPDWIFHCAAYTAVDAAETDVDGAYLVNAIGTRNMALAAEKIDAKIVFISTDYVYSGTTERPYIE